MYTPILDRTKHQSSHVQFCKLLVCFILLSHLAAQLDFDHGKALRASLDHWNADITNIITGRHESLRSGRLYDDFTMSRKYISDESLPWALWSLMLLKTRGANGVYVSS